MSAQVRFLALALIGWAGVRAATLGMIPGSEGYFAARPAAAATTPPIVPTSFPPIEPVQAQVAPAAASMAGLSQILPAAMPVYYYPAPYAVAASRPMRAPPMTPLDLPEPRAQFYAPLPNLDDWQMSRLASSAIPAWRQGGVSTPVAISPEARKRLDRLQLTMWALLRNRPGDHTLASGSMLGGSQAGARLTYAVTPQIAASLRSSAPIGSQRGGEVAAGVRFTPFRSIPVAITAERRQAIGAYGGRNAFALFAEGGVYQRPILWGFDLDAYLQAGVVGARSRDLFADGGFALTRPVYGQFYAGFGVWGGAQPGLYRVDAGPRVSMRVRHNMRVDLDWRQRLTGNAQPGSGPAVTLAADF